MLVIQYKLWDTFHLEKYTVLHYQEKLKLREKIELAENMYTFDICD